MVFELRYVPRENATPDPRSRYDAGFGFAQLVTDTDDDAQAEDLALRQFYHQPPVDLAFWTFDFPPQEYR